MTAQEGKDLLIKSMVRAWRCLARHSPAARGTTSCGSAWTITS